MFALRTTEEVQCIGVIEVWLMSAILLLMITGILYIVHSGLSVTKSVDLKVNLALFFLFPHFL